MKSPSECTFDEIALAEELAGQLAHDFGGFLQHLLARLELAELPAAQPPDWAAVRREAEQLIHLIREWDRCRALPSEPRPIDLNGLVRKAVRMLRAEGTTKIKVRLTSESTILTTVPIDARRLFELLLRPAFHKVNTSDAWVSVETRIEAETIVLRLGNLSSCDPSLLDEDAGASPSLVAKTCRSLAARLECRLHAERQTDGVFAIAVVFPRQI